MAPSNAATLDFARQYGLVSASSAERAMRDFWASGDPAKMLNVLRDRASDRKLRLFACACCRAVWDRLTDDVPCPTCGRLDRPTFQAQFGRGPLCVDCGGKDANGNALPGTGRINRSRRAVEVAERFADGQETEAELLRARHDAGRAVLDATNDFPRRLTETPPIPDLHPTISFNRFWSDSRSADIPPATQAALLRDIVGNPFCAVTLDPAWRTPNVVALARAAYDDRPARACGRCRGDGWIFAGYDDDREECPGCRGTGRVADGHLCPDRLAVLSDAMEDAGCDDARILEHLRGPGPHCRGCWVLDLLLGKE